ncbi:MAG: FtsX-like permease family protein [Thiovulaceae bacterium]|nr:FtsX-like permease family protein [Sulfurimonadaceae bacterium]
MLLTIAWRNIWRAKGKTRVTLILLTLSTMVLVTFISLIIGTFNHIYDDAMDIYPGNIHVNHPKYANEPSYDYLLSDAVSLKEKLKNEKSVAVVTTRMESFFLFSSNENSVAGMLSGIEPETEIKTSKLHTTLIKGRFLTPNDTNKIVIGKTFAKNLNVTLGDTVSIMGNAVDYSFAAANLTVVGIFQTAIPKLDGGLAMINKPYLDTQIGAQGLASRLIITPEKRDQSFALAQTLNEKYSTKGLEIIDWHTHMATMIEGLDLIRISRYMLIYFFIAIIFAVITIFALLMLYARKKEIGVMRALGTTPTQIVGIILIERIILTLISIAVGLVISGYLAYYYEVNPIHIESAGKMVQRLGAMEFVLKTNFSWGTMIQGAITIFLLSIVTVIYPIWKISKEKPIDAIHSI